jgi:hypothetical protein
MLGLGDENVRNVRSDLLGIAAKRGSVAGDPYVMGEYLKPRVKEYKFDVSASLNDAKKALDDGYQLITAGYFTGSGHVISLVGYEPDPRTLGYRFIVDDPWSIFSFPDWAYLDLKQSGDNVRYSSYGIYASCVASQSKWEAARIYRNGELDSAKNGMWLHYIKN